MVGRPQVQPSNSPSTKDEDVTSEETPTANRITARGLHQALIDAGIIRRGEHVRRIVIDAEVDKAVTMHVERWADERLLDVVPILDGVQIREVNRD
jgi:hypothetical protein